MMKGQIIRLSWILPNLLYNGCRPHCLHQWLLIRACKISAGTQESVAPLLVACVTAPLKMPFMMHVKSWLLIGHHSYMVSELHA